MQRPGIPVIHQELSFPDPATARTDGLLAVGGDLSVARLLLAYRMGIFPWSSAPISWWCPDPRSIIPFGGIHIPRSLARRLRNHSWTITLNLAFRQVIEACAAPAPGREETWIEPPLIEAYHQLHLAGHAHSIEVWENSTLIGGVYGVAIGGFFAGESMFHRRSDASKVALVSLLAHLKSRGFVLFDTQIASPLTRSLGAIDIPRRSYLERLGQAVDLDVSIL